MADRAGRGDEKSGSVGLALRNPLLSMLAALRFLTILPISWKAEEDGRFFQASLLWFPLVGLLVGTGALVAVSLCLQVFPPSVTAVLAMAFLAGISGCLHLDGLADSGDGLLSSRPRERALEIMRDSRSGAMGMIFLLFVLLGKYAALSTLSPELLVQAVILMPLAGRTAILLSMVSLPYARSGDGLGRLFYSSDKYWLAAIGLCFTVTVFILLLSWQGAFSLLLAVFMTVALFSFWCFRKLGGATGDTLGAVCELTELTTAMTFVLLSAAV